MEHRVKEQKRARVSGDVDTSALAENTIEHSHKIIGRRLVMVLDSHSHVDQCCALEAWHIRRQSGSMNRERGLLSTAYDALLRQYARH